MTIDNWSFTLMGRGVGVRSENSEDSIREEDMQVDNRYMIAGDLDE